MAQLQNQIDHSRRHQYYNSLNVYAYTLMMNAHFFVGRYLDSPLQAVNQLEDNHRSHFEQLRNSFSCTCLPACLQHTRFIFTIINVSVSPCIQSINSTSNVGCVWVFFANVDVPYCNQSSIHSSKYNHMPKQRGFTFTIDLGIILRNLFLGQHTHEIRENKYA